MYKAHEQRVIDEHSELGTKIDKLDRFFESGFCDTLTVEESVLLRRQFNYMVGYLGVLADRIALFNKETYDTKQN
jgi:hypothetical protein